MQVAARNGSLDVLKRLYELGGDINSKGPDDENLFHIAGSNGHIHVLAWLLGIGFDPASTTAKGQSLAHIAARRGELLVVKFLYFMCHLDFNRVDDDGMTPMECIPRYGPENIPEVKQFISMITAPPESRDLYVFVLEREAVSMRKYLLKSGILFTGEKVSSSL